MSYDDRPGFGRVALDVPYAVLRDQVADQVTTLSTIAAEEGTRVRYLKPHGALYHRVAVDEDQARAVLDGSGDLPVLGMPGALVLSLAADAGGPSTPRPSRTVRTARTGGCGRAPSRARCWTTPRPSRTRAVALAAGVDSVCVHGDTPGAVGHAGAVRAALEAAGYDVRPFG